MAEYADNDVQQLGQSSSSRGDRGVSIADAIIRRHSLPAGLIEILNGLEPNEYYSLLLAASEARAKRVNPGKLLHEYESSGLCLPSPADPRALHGIEGLIYSLLPPHFAPIELSPVTPFGINSSLSGNSQKKILSTIRNAEVLADPTTALAIEGCRIRSRYLKEDPRSPDDVSICAFSRALRLQAFDPKSGFLPHFQTFAAATVGRDTGHEEFEFRCLREHIGIYLALLETSRDRGYSSSEVEVFISDIRLSEALVKEYGLDREEIGLHTQDDDFDPLARFTTFGAKEDRLSDSALEEIARLGLHNTAYALGRVQSELIEPLAEDYPRVHFAFDLHRYAGLGYYSGFCFKIRAKNGDGKSFPLADGGSSDWSRCLLQNRKERVFSSGFGTELYVMQFLEESRHLENE